MGEEAASCLGDLEAYLVDLEAYLVEHSYLVVQVAFPYLEVVVAYPCPVVEAACPFLEVEAACSFLEVEEAFPFRVEEVAFPFLEVEAVMNHLTTLHQEGVEEEELIHSYREGEVGEEASPFQEEEEYLQAIADIANHIVI